MGRQLEISAVTTGELTKEEYEQYLKETSPENLDKSLSQLEKEGVSTKYKKEREEKEKKQKKERSISNQLTRAKEKFGFLGSPVTTAVLGGTLALLVAPTATLAVAKSVIPASTGGKLALAVAVPIVGGAILSQPEKATEIIVEAPSRLFNFGGNVGDLMADPSIENLKRTYKENPLITTGAGLGIVATIGGGIGLAANTLATQLNTRATNANTGGTEADSTLPTEKVIVPQKEIYPETAETTTITTGKTRRYRARKKEIPSVNQRVQVLVNNRSQGFSIRKIYKEALIN